MLEITTTGRVSAWGEDRSHSGGCEDSSCRHLGGARGNIPPERLLLPLLMPSPKRASALPASIFTHFQFLLESLIAVSDREADDVQLLCHAQQTLGQPQP